MISKALSVVAVASMVFVINVSAALGQNDPAGPPDPGLTGSDPTKIGENTRSIVEPNAKAFWWIALVIGVLGMAFSRKASRAGGIGILLLVSGIVIYNPIGIASMMRGIANKIV